MDQQQTPQLISKSKILPLKQDLQEQSFDILPVSHSRNQNVQQFKTVHQVLNKSPAKGIFNLQGLKKDETIEHLQEQLRESKKSKTELHEKYVHLEISYQKLYDENKNLVFKVQEFEKEREELLKQLKETQESNSQRDYDRNQNNNKLETLSVENCQLQYKVNQQDQEIIDLQEICQIKDIQIGVIKTDLKIAQDTMKQLKQVIETKESQFKKCMAKMKQQQLTLQGQITQCSTENLNISKQVYDQLGERFQLVTQLNDQSNFNEIHRTSAEQYKSNFEELRSKFIEFKIINQEKIETLQATNEKLLAQINKSNS